MSQLPALPYTALEIVEIRRQLVSLHPNSDRTQRDFDADCIDGALGSALQSAYYLSSDGTPEPIHIAAHLLFAITKRHCFTDGNKRVAWAVTVDYLLMQGLAIVADEEEAAVLVEGVASNIHSAKDLIEWLGADNRLQTVF